MNRRNSQVVAASSGLSEDGAVAVPSGLIGLGVNLLRNAFAGFFALVAWTGVGVWVARTQGVEVWGLLTLFATGQVLATAFELGLSLYVTRRVARSTRRWPVRMLSAAEVLSLAQAGCIVTLGLLLGATGAGKWLAAATVDAATVTRSLAWLGLAIGCAWPATFYRSILAGLGSQVAFARSLAYFGAARIVVVVPVLAIAGSLDWAFGAMCVVGVLESGVSRALARAHTAPFSFLRASALAVRRLFRRNLRLGVSASLVGVNGSLDKVVVASVLDLRTLAIYNSAWMVCSAALWTLQPVTQSFYPRICQTVHDRTALWRTNLLLSGAVALILIPAAVVALVIGRVLAPMWLDDANAQGIFYYFVALMIVGVAINSQTILSWYAGLASDDTSRNLHVGLAAALFTVFVFPWLLAHVGLAVAPASWLFINLLGLAYPGVVIAARLQRTATSLLLSVAVIAVVTGAALLVLPSPLQVLHGAH